MSQPDADGLAAFVRRHDPDRFLSVMLAPPGRREALLVLYAFNHELARAREVTREPMLALIRLQWWREVVDGARRRHEVAGPLGSALDRGLLSAADLRGMIDAREFECDAEIPDLVTWRRMVEGVGGGLAVAAGRSLGADLSTLERLRLLGAGYGVAAQLGRVGALASRNLCLLPVDRLAAHDLRPEDIITDPGRAEALRPELAQIGLDLIEQGGGRFAGSVVSAGLPAVLGRRDLRRGGRRRSLGDTLAVLTAAALRKI